MKNFPTKLVRMKLSSLPKDVFILALTFFIVGFLLQVWRLYSLSATYDQALFLQELWSSSRGNFFESSLSSELSAAVKLEGELPRVDYLHIGQHANILTVIFGTPLVALIGQLGLPLLQIFLIAIAGVVLWKIAIRNVEKEIAYKITISYYLSGIVIGPSIENFHDFCWFPILGFLIFDALQRKLWIKALLFSLMLLMAREDSGITVFSIGIWSYFRQPKGRTVGLIIMLLAFLYMTTMTNWIQPYFDTSVSDRFLQEKFAHILGGQPASTLSLLGVMISHPMRVINALVDPPGSTLSFLLAISLPLALIPLISLDVGLMILVPLFVALISQGMSALSVTLRYVMVLVPGIFCGTILWWKSNPDYYQKRWLRRFWTACISLGFVITVLSNPYRSLSAFIPDSFSPWVHVNPISMLHRRDVVRRASLSIPKDSPISADTPLLPLVAQREVVLRFPEHVQYLNREDKVRSVEWIFAFPDYYKPFIPLFKEETARWKAVNQKLLALVENGNYGVHYCNDGVVILKKNLKKTERSNNCFEALDSKI